MIIPRVDVHCHAHDTPEQISLMGGSSHVAPEALPSDHSRVKTRWMCLMGTHYHDWDTVAEFTRKYPDRFIPAFGIHPWFVRRVPNLPDNDIDHEAFDAGLGIPASWEARLCELLEEFPQAIVGECDLLRFQSLDVVAGNYTHIGLDKIATHPIEKTRYPFQPQIHLFNRHIDIAAKYGRPISLHCVKGQGALLNILQGTPVTCLPPKIMLHSYSGSLESLKSLLKLGTVGKERIYFSFSQFVNGRSSKFVEVIKHVPDDRILVESDYHNLESIDAQMDEVERLVASAKGWSAEKAREASYANSCEFFGL